MEMPQQSTPTSMSIVPTKQSFFSKYKFTLISLFIILLAAIPLLVLSNKKPTTQQPTSQTAVVSPTPTVVPLTASNADTTFNKADQQMQQTLNQADTDLQTVNQINTSQDSTSGL